MEVEASIIDLEIDRNQNIHNGWCNFCNQVQLITLSDFDNYVDKYGFVNCLLALNEMASMSCKCNEGDSWRHKKKAEQSFDNSVKQLEQYCARFGYTVSDELKEYLKDCRKIITGENVAKLSIDFGAIKISLKRDKEGWIILEYKYTNKDSSIAMGG